MALKTVLLHMAHDETRLLRFRVALALANVTTRI